MDMHAKPGFTSYTFELAGEFTQAIRVCRPNSVAQIPNIIDADLGIQVDPSTGTIEGVMVGLRDKANHKLYISGPWTVGEGLDQETHVRLLERSVHACFN